MEKSCVKCGKKEFLTHHKTYIYRSATIHCFRDSRGRYWNGNHCHACSLDRARKKMGHGARGSKKNPKKTSTLEAVRCEKIAAKFFRKLGFKVEEMHGAGPDLFCDMGDFSWKVEVKKAHINSRRWRTSRVTPARQSDDLVAIVMPNGRVYLDSMRHHLSKCEKYGTRTITPIVKEFGLDKTL